MSASGAFGGGYGDLGFKGFTQSLEGPDEALFHETNICLIHFPSLPQENGGRCVVRVSGVDGNLLGFQPEPLSRAPPEAGS